MIVPFDLLSIFVAVAWCCHILSPSPIRIRRPWQQLETQRLFSRLSPVRSMETVREARLNHHGVVARYGKIQVDLRSPNEPHPKCYQPWDHGTNDENCLKLCLLLDPMGALVEAGRATGGCTPLWCNTNKSVFLVIALLPPPSTVALIIVGSSNPHPKAIPHIISTSSVKKRLCCLHGKLVIFP